MYKTIVLIIAILTLTGCSSSKSKIATTKDRGSKTTNTYSSKKSNSAENKESKSEVIVSTSKTVVTSDLINGYIFHYKDIAMSNMRNYGIPASIILAQGILESGAGQGKLATTANNHFGIKCYTDWTGETIHQDDDASQECFRKYINPEESFQDHANILSKRKRYAALFKIQKGDYKSWANGLKTAGYATDTKYPEKLISYIERYHLDQYDAIVLRRNTVSLEDNDARKLASNENNSNEKSKSHEVQKGDTLYSISIKYNIPIEELKKQNNLFDNTISIGQTIIIQK